MKDKLYYTEGDSYYHEGELYYICSIGNKYVGLSTDPGCESMNLTMAQTDIVKENFHKLKSNRVDLDILFSNTEAANVKLDIFTRDDTLSTKANIDKTKLFIQKFILYLANFEVSRKLVFKNGTELSFLGEGVYGSAFLLSNGKTEYVVKIQACDDPAFSNELKFMRKANAVRYKQKIEFLPKLYGVTSYNNICVLIMEKADVTLKDLMVKGIKNNSYNCNAVLKYKSILQQVVISIFYVHHYIKIVHSDVKSENIFYFKKNPMGSITINSNTFEVQNCGFRLVLFDYGVSHLLDTYSKHRKRNMIAFDDYEMFEHFYIPEKIKSKFEPFFETYLSLEPSYSYSKLATLLLKSLEDV